MSKQVTVSFGIYESLLKEVRRTSRRGIAEIHRDIGYSDTVYYGWRDRGTAPLVAHWALRGYSNWLRNRKSGSTKSGSETKPAAEPQAVKPEVKLEEGEVATLQDLLIVAARNPHYSKINDTINNGFAILRKYG